MVDVHACFSEFLAGSKKLPQTMKEVKTEVPDPVEESSPVITLKEVKNEVDDY